MGVVTSQAFSTGIGAMPTPITEMDWDGWLWHSFFEVHGPVVSSTELNSPAMAQRIEIDSKAMRKLGLQETLFMAAEFTELGTATATIRVGTRVLLKLP